MPTKRQVTVVRVTGPSASRLRVDEPLLKKTIIDELNEEEKQNSKFKITIIPSCRNDDDSLVALIDFQNGLPSFYPS